MQKKEELSFISYLDDNDNVVNGFYHIVIIKEGFVEFARHEKNIIIPMHRVRKIKHTVPPRGQNDREE